MIIKIEYQTNGPYKSVEQMIDICGRLELPTSQFYSEQEKTMIQIAQGVRIDISEHFGPILWLFPPKEIQYFNSKISVTVTNNDQILTFPHNNADCYGISEKDVIEVVSTKNNQITSSKIILSRLKIIEEDKESQA